MFELNQNASLPVKFLWLAFFVLCGMFIASCLSIFFPTTDIIALKWLQIAQTLLIFALPSFAYWYFTKMPVSEWKTAPKNWQIWLVALWLMPCAIPAVNFTKWLNDMLVLPDFLSNLEQWMKLKEAQNATITEKFLQIDSWQGLLLNLLALAAIPAFAEELFFRGTMQKIFSEKWNAHIAIWITAFIFSAIHMQFYGFLPRFLLGAALGYLFWISSSIWTSIAAHFINNALTVLFAFCTTNGFFTFDIDKIGIEKTWWIGALSLAVTCALIVILTFWKRRANLAKKK